VSRTEVPAAPIPAATTLQKKHRKRPNDPTRSGAGNCTKISANGGAPLNVRYWGNSGQSWVLASGGLSAFDPQATLAVHCGNRFDTGLAPPKFGYRNM
jgi:hypothetical protein